MDLDPLICSQARLSPDARFDGRFFIGVKSTRIYCRSICPVRTVKKENVRYFPTAAFVKEALVKNIALTFMNHPQGVHGFDNQNDDERSREIIRSAIAFMQIHLSASGK